MPDADGRDRIDRTPVGSAGGPKRLLTLSHSIEIQANASYFL